MAFLILGIYGSGCLLMALLSIFARCRDGKWSEGSVLVILLWPVILIMPIVAFVEWISERKHQRALAAVEQASKFGFERLIDDSLAAAKNFVGTDLTLFEKLSESFAEFKGTSYKTIPRSKIAQSLNQFWLRGGTPFDYSDQLQEFPHPRVVLGSVRFRAPQQWLIAMSREFIKSIQSIDRKLQGRILEAIADISSDPITVKGDTMKPLTRELKGLWRYRLGDYRLVYQPVPERMEVLLVDFDSRGNVYG